VSFSLGIDIGGTFTDIVVYDHVAGRQLNRKVLTTHDDPARAVAAGVASLLERHRLPPAEFTRVVHATTLFTNALIERRGAVTGLLTTAGFADTLEIGRERKFELYDLNIVKPEPLVPRHLRLEVAERTRADGSVATRLDVRQVEAQARRLAQAGVTSIAVVFLHAYANPRHEAEAARRIARRHKTIAVTTSHEVAPEIREYERASTTVANAYIKPLARQYLDAMARRVAGLGIPAPLLLMLSSGGLTHVAEAERTPVQMLESGPAAGALAAAFFGREDSRGNLLAFDMGGTTAKLSLVDGGEPLTAYAFEAARQKRFLEGSGLPIRISTIELIEIGAGGGSIAHVDEIGLLKVGPRSAGSQPGPAAYGLGGGEPTVTDADFALGYLNPDYFAGGEMRIDMPAARVDRVATVGLRLDRDSVAALEQAFARLEGDARAVLADSGLALDAATVRRLADGRFLGQGFDLVVELPAGPYDGSDAGRRSLTAAFETAYREKFALTPPDVPIEFINVRVAMRAPVSERAGGGVATAAAGLGEAAARGGAVKGTRPAYFPQPRGFEETTVYDRARLALGDEIRGPAVVEEDGSTLVIGPGGVGRVAASGNIVVTLP
jgi:N-methylhydantoinase A/oxoprolinase/acetone carboxylase beta subunit